MLVNSLKEAAHDLLHKFGVDIKRYNLDNFFELRRAKLLSKLGIDLVLDVGANCGQFAQSLRKTGYRGRIISFEPLSQAYEQLEARARRDSKWQAVKLALSNSEGESEINISANLESSSLLPMLDTHQKNAPKSRYVGKEKIKTITLDHLFAREPNAYAGHIYLKIDVQGFEKAVLDGAIESFSKIDAIELELSLTPLYEKQPLFSELTAYLASLDFELICLENVFVDQHSGRVLQVNGIFVRHGNPAINQ
jgi:FkbM family methyltransferase